MALGVLAASLLASSANAADHRDGPSSALKDPTVDITDVYSWLSADASRVYLVMDLQGADTGAVAGTTKFSNAALYVFHINAGSKYADPAAKESQIICQFDNQSTQNFQCWGPGGEYVTDAVGNTSGKMSTSGKMKVAATVRDDPFWFNIRGFRALSATVPQVAGSLTFDKAGCPAIDAQTSQTIVGLLTTDGTGTPNTAKDDFGKGGAAPFGKGVTTNGNVLSIAIAIDKTVLTTNGTMLGIWGSTNMVGQ
jgi:hypothetical protein